MNVLIILHDLRQQYLRIKCERKARVKRRDLNFYEPLHVCEGRGHTNKLLITDFYWCRLSFILAQRSQYIRMIKARVKARGKRYRQLSVPRFFFTLRLFLFFIKYGEHKELSRNKQVINFLSHVEEKESTSVNNFLARPIIERAKSITCSALKACTFNSIKDMLVKRGSISIDVYDEYP